MKDDFDFHREVFRSQNKTPLVAGSSLRAFQSLIATIAILGMAAWFLTLVGVGEKDTPQPSSKMVSPRNGKLPGKNPSPDPFFYDEKFNRHWEVM